MIDLDSLTTSLNDVPFFSIVFVMNTATLDINYDTVFEKRSLTILFFHWFSITYAGWLLYFLKITRNYPIDDSQNQWEYKIIWSDNVTRRNTIEDEDNEFFIVDLHRVARHHLSYCSSVRRLFYLLYVWRWRVKVDCIYYDVCTCHLTSIVVYYVVWRHKYQS